MNYAVVDLPVLSNAEQCADACMRLKAEYLYQTGQYNKIKFQDDNGQSLRYSGGASGEAFYRYLRRHLIRQLRKSISLPLVHIRRQREEIPLVHYSLQSNWLETLLSAKANSLSFDDRITLQTAIARSLYWRLYSLISVCHFRYEKVAHACFLLITTTHFEYRHFFLSELLPSTTIRTLALVTADFHSQNIAVR